MQIFYINSREDQEKLIKGDIVMAVGDLSNWVGLYNALVEDAMKKRGLNGRSNNREMFVDFCSFHTDRWATFRLTGYARLIKLITLRSKFSEEFLGPLHKDGLFRSLHNDEIYQRHHNRLVVDKIRNNRWGWSSL